MKSLAKQIINKGLCVNVFVCLYQGFTKAQKTVVGVAQPDYAK